MGSPKPSNRRKTPMKSIRTDLVVPPHVALADHFADPGASERPLRIRLTSGEAFDCHAPVFDIEELVLVVTTSGGVTRKVRPADIQTLSERRPSWPAYASLGLVTVVPGAGLSALLVPLLSPLGALDGAILGAFGGAVAFATVPWVLATFSPVAYSRLLGRTGFAHWRTVFAKGEPPCARSQ